MDDPITWKKDETPKTIYSPVHKNLELSYKDDDNKDHFYTIEPLSVSTHPTYRADIFIEDILTAYMDELNVGYLTPDEREILKKEIYDG